MRTAKCQLYILANMQMYWKLWLMLWDKMDRKYKLIMHFWFSWSLLPAWFLLFNSTLLEICYSSDSFRQIIIILFIILYRIIVWNFYLVIWKIIYFNYHLCMFVCLWFWCKLLKWSFLQCIKYYLLEWKLWAFSFFVDLLLLLLTEWD